MDSVKALERVVCSIPYSKRVALKAEIEHLISITKPDDVAGLASNFLSPDLRGKHWSTRPVLLYTRDHTPDEYVRCTESEAAEALGITLQKLQQNLRGSGITQIRRLSEQAMRKKPPFPGVKVDYFEGDYEFWIVERVRGDEAR
jgi:hypothetical protein